MDKLEHLKEARLQRRLDMFTVDDPKCACGEDRPFALRDPALDSKEAITCLNCWLSRRHNTLPVEEQARLDKMKLKKLGSLLRICLACGETRLCTLELHHPLQKAVSPVVQVDCANCHAEFSEAQRYHLIDLQSSDPRFRDAKYFLAMSDELMIRATRRQKIVDRIDAALREIDDVR